MACSQLTRYVHMMILIMCHQATTTVAMTTGTTADLRNIVIGRCHEYQNLVNPAMFEPPNSKRDCEELYDLFEASFIGVDPQDVYPSNYSSFVLAGLHETPPNKVLFWEGLMGFIQQYTNKGERYTAISDTLTGYMLDQLEWCGMNNSSEPNYEICEGGWYRPSESFWKQASIQFSENARGDVYLMLNGSEYPVFPVNGTFSRYELVNLGSPRVPTFHTFVMKEIGTVMRESCGQGSLLTLQQTVEKQGIQFTCTDNPTELMYYQCVDKMDADECRTSDGGTAASLQLSHLNIICPLVLLLLLSPEQ